MAFSETLVMFDFMLMISQFKIDWKCLSVTKARGDTSRNVLHEMFSFTAILVLPQQLEN